MIKSLFGKIAALPPSKLPQLNSFVDVMVAGRPARSVTVEFVGPKGVATRESLGKPGESAILVYTTMAGRFRAATKVQSATPTSTLFDLPRRADMIGASTGAQKRSTVRLDALVSGHWRFAPGGKGTGDFGRATIRDISRGGCSLIIDREVKTGMWVEIKLALRADQSLVLVGEVMRHEEIEKSAKHSHGLRFHGVRPAEDQAIIDFINRKQADLRNRGLA